MESWKLELYHHGILGQKWGDRNGPPYPLKSGDRSAIERYFKNRSEKYINYMNSSYDKNELRKDKKTYKRKFKKEGLNIGNKYDSLNKGIKLQRVTNKEETLEGPKYVSVLDDDKRLYESADFFDDLLNIRIDEYTTKKKLKIAKSKEVSEYIIKKYGNKNIETIYSDMNKIHNVEWYGKKIVNDKNDKNAIRSETMEGFGILNNLYKRTLFESPISKKDIHEHFYKKGYDAIIDLEDIGYADYPLIILKSEESLIKSGTRSD